MEKIWFILDAEKIKGPLSTADVEAQKKSGQYTKSCKIWWKGQRDWISITKWRPESYIRTQDSAKEASLWYAEKQGQTLGPLSKSELVIFLGKLESLSEVKIWKRGQQKWATVYQQSDVAEDLGISRRRFPRAPLIAEVSVEKDKQEYTAQAASVSTGGIGLTHISGLNRGDEIKLSIKSPLLSQTIYTKAVVKHVSAHLAGIEFISLHTEYQSTIADYVSQYLMKSSETKKAA